MPTAHLHSVKLENGNFHHLFNIMFMTASELEILQRLLDGKPIAVDKIDMLNNIKATIHNVAQTAGARDSEAYAEKENLKLLKPTSAEAEESPEGTYEGSPIAEKAEEPEEETKEE